MSDINDAIKHLNYGKKDCNVNLFSGHLIHSTFKARSLLSVLFSSMFIHGYIPVNMLTSTMVPLPKVRGTNKSENFRAITLSNVIYKLLKLVIQNKSEKCLYTSNMQFGFKKNSSTTNCTFIVQETISHHNNQNSNVLYTLLDASKAFDRLHFPLLFEKLRTRNICPVLLRLLLYMYVHQKIRVKWNNAM